MAALEGEAFLSGKWDSIQHLEESLNLKELELFVKQSREREFRYMRFYGLFKGVDLNDQTAEDGLSTKERFEAAERRAQQRLAGMTPEEIERDEFAEFGIEYEVI